MMHNLLLDALLLMILWLYVILLWVGLRCQATTSQADCQSAKRSMRRVQDPKPFPGLTTQPLCPTCEHAPPPAPQRPSCPPLLRNSPRGRRHQVATQQHYCPTPEWDYSGWAGRGNLRANGHPSGGPWRQWHGMVCGGYFLETHGTLLHGTHVPPERLVWAVAALAEGLGLRAVARVFEIDPNPVLAWVVEAADQVAAFSQYLLHDMRVTQVQLDELFALLSAVKAGDSGAVEAIRRLSRSPHWVWAAIDPMSQLLLTIDVGDRTLTVAQRVVHQLVQVLAPDCVPLFLTDGFKEYMTALLTPFGHWVQPPRRHATGPAPKPRWMPLPELLYAQVVKRYRRRRLARASHQVIFGTREAVKQAWAAQGWQINTAFIERLHLTIRQHVAAVGRRDLTLGKGEEGLRHQLALYQLYYNFCLPHASLHQPLPAPEPTHGHGSAKHWRPRTPAMAAGLTDHVWTLREVLLFRVPPWPQPHSVSAAGEGDDRRGEWARRARKQVERAASGSGTLI